MTFPNPLIFRYHLPLRHILKSHLSFFEPVKTIILLKWLHRILENLREREMALEREEEVQVEVVIDLSCFRLVCTECNAIPLSGGHILGSGAESLGTRQSSGP
jgi:hypothetical protein